MIRVHRTQAIAMLLAGTVVVFAAARSAAEDQNSRQALDSSRTESAHPEKEPVPLGVACFGDTSEEAYEGLYGFVGYIDERRVTTRHLERAINCKDYGGQVSIVLGPDATVSTKIFAILPVNARFNAQFFPPMFDGSPDQMRREIRTLCDNNDKHPRRDFPLELHRYQITRTVFSSDWRLFTLNRDGQYVEAVDPDFDSDKYVIAVTRAGEAKFDKLCQMSRHARDFEERFEAYFVEIAATRLTDD